MANECMLNRSIGRWCLEFDCWPEDHPGCEKRETQGCVNCIKSLNLIIYENKSIKSPDDEILLN